MSRTTLKVPTANTKTTMIMTISCRVSPNGVGWAPCHGEVLMSAGGVGSTPARIAGSATGAAV
jgi:hypothetical protein